MDQNLNTLIEKCYETTKITPEDEFNSLPDKNLLADKLKDLNIYDNTHIDNDKKIHYLKELENIALNDEYFIKRGLYPNVDFYSGIILRAMGIPTDLFTVLFTVARTVGWLAQWDEMIGDPSQKIGRPRQLYTGPSERSFVPIENR